MKQSHLFDKAILLFQSFGMAMGLLLFLSTKYEWAYEILDAIESAMIGIIFFVISLPLIFLWFKSVDRLLENLR